MILVDGSGEVLAVNRAASSMCGLVGRSVRGRDVWQLLKEAFSIDHESLAPLSRPGGRLLAGPAAGVDGRLLIVRNELKSPFAGVDGFLLQMVEVGLDQLFRHQKDRSSRYEALRGMATRMSRTVREGLGSIELYASLLRRSLADDPESEQIAARIIDVAGAVVPSLENFSSFAELRQPHPVWFDLAELCGETAARLRLAAGDGAEVVVRGEGECRIFADRAMIAQLLFNLGANGLEHGASSLPLLLEYRMLRAPGQSFAEVRVRDHGPGISPEVGERMFDPFFSTREGAMGLGLPVCHAVAEAHGGCVSWENCGGGGAVFTVVIPVETT